MTRDRESNPRMLPLSAHGNHVVCLFPRPRDPSGACPMPLEGPSGTGADSISSAWTKSPGPPTTLERPESSSARPESSLARVESSLACSESSSDRIQATSARMDTLSARAEWKHRPVGTKYPRGGTKDPLGGNDVHTAADIIGARPDNVAVERSAEGVRRVSSESRCPVVKARHSPRDPSNAHERNVPSATFRKVGDTIQRLTRPGLAPGRW